MAKLFKLEDTIKLTPYKKRRRGRPSRAAIDEEIAYYALKLGLIEFLADGTVRKFVDRQIRYLGLFATPEFVWVGKILYYRLDKENFEVVWDIADTLIKGAFETNIEYPEVICKCGCPDFRVLSSGYVVCSDCKSEMAV